MSQEINRQELAMRYLLGTLSEEEKARLEEQYFLNDTEFEQLEIAEDELIDRYVQTELSAEDMSRFEKLMISPRLSERVEVARLLAQRSVSRSQIRELAQEPQISPERVQPPRAGWLERLFGPAAVAAPAFTPTVAISLILALLSTVTLVFVWMRLRTESQRLAQDQQQREELSRQIAEQKAKHGELEEALNQTRLEKEQQEQLIEKLLAEQQQRSTPALSFPFYLDPGVGNRSSIGDSAQTIRIPRGVASVGVSLNVTQGDYSHYDAFMRNTDSGNEIVKRAHLKPFSHRGRKYITLKLDAKLLPPGNYNVRVNGITATGLSQNFDDYPFRVLSR